MKSLFIPKVTKTLVQSLLVFLLLAFSCNAYSQTNNSRESNTTNLSNKKVLIHYMGWFGDTIADNVNDDILRHWKYGHANEPYIGNYDSKNRSLLTYHILLSWSCGIDGIVINVKDKYDDICMRNLAKTIKWIREIDSTNFKYEFGISYDDQGSYPVDVIANKLSYLRDSILPVLPNYLEYNGRPAIFVFDYPQMFLTMQELRDVLSSVFADKPPLLICNELDGKENNNKYVDAFFPWVQPGGNWDKNGMTWGKGFLDWFYQRVNEINTHNQYIFTCGGVWVGFDDRKNTSWGGNRLIARRNGLVYDSTWSYVLNYKKSLPLDWVVIETWNDWNEGTEIEPSIEDGYKYLLLTIKNINAFKGTKIESDTLKFEAAQKIYLASHIIETNTNTRVYSPALKEAISKFLHKDFQSSIDIANHIINTTSSNE